ncbi:MAG: 1-deoxy-D-xylulose-5-phosphate synthase [Chromatiales bacterium]|jgi:1-deoxy-D-xylulose-5-phosphate synthase|nr:1-deoxy-D-xylulose-5-phosphate synthase [Chromatiales bacterium]
MDDPQRFPLLLTIDSPADLRRLPVEQLQTVADELRDYIIASVSRTGGHLSASLGTVELTVALHYVFNTPIDHLVWDVGHQSYGHKILTGRRREMATLRKRGGISGFLKRSESAFDVFGAGHSSTSISAALGLAIAAQQRGEKRQSIAVIGDGAMTAGMAFEALNHAGNSESDLLVILNDNEMSISRNVGGMSSYLAKLLSGRLYATVREGGKKMLSVVPPVRELARRAEEHVKGMVTPGTLFEELGFNYIGPIDGHDLDTLVVTLRNLQSLKGPQFLHVVTRKGKGYRPAEENPCAYHGVSAFDPAVGLHLVPSKGKPSYSQIFGDWLCDMAAADPAMVAITPAMCEGSGMVEFAQRYPERFFDVGIAEQHAVTLAGGLACGGLHPVVAIYSTFLQRAYDQLVHDIALQNLPVLFAIDRAGVTGPDGATHAGAFDLSFLRCIPNMLIMAPSDEDECYRMLTTGLRHDGPSAVRYPRGGGPGRAVERSTAALTTSLPIGRAEVRRKGQRVSILAFGSALGTALEVAARIDASVVNMRFVKPLDAQTVLQQATTHELLVTIEDNAVMGGAGSAVNECLAAHGVDAAILNLGLLDVFGEHGSRDELLADSGLDPDAIESAIARRLAPILAKTPRLA